MYGTGHTGTGGDAVAEEVGRALGLGPKSRAFEIASGLGGSAFAIAKVPPSFAQSTRACFSILETHIINDECLN